MNLISTIRSSESFIFNNIQSSEYGLVNINLDGGLLEETFIPSRRIIEEKIRGRSEPYFMGLEYEPLEFTLNFAFIGGFDTSKLRAVARWFSTSYFAPMIFSEKPDRIYYCIATDEPKLIHTGANQGYVTINFRCNSPWSYSPVYGSPVYDYSENVPEGTVLKFNNVGDLTVKPTLIVDIVSGTHFKIQNLSDDGNFIEFNELATGESLRIDGDLRTIDSNIPLSFPYDKQLYGSDFIKLLQGVNHLRIYGNIRLKLINQFIYIG